MFSLKKIPWESPISTMHSAINPINFILCINSKTK
jgi:hypothetical protein